MNMEERSAEAVDSAVPYLQQFREKVRGSDDPFFSTPELRQRLDLLRHLTDNSEKVLLVKGVEGAGKSTLLEQFKRDSREEWDLCCFDASPTFHPDQLYSRLYRRYGLTDQADLTVEQLIKRFELLVAAARKAVIVIDDAHLLPVATLIALFRLFERRPGNRALIRIVLFASPDIVNQFQTPQLQAMNLQSIQSLEMPLLDSKQSESFVHFLLDIWKVTGHVKLSGGSLNRLQRDSNGLPGKIEAQLRLIFSDASSQKKRAGSADEQKAIPVAKGLFSDLPKPVLVGIGLLGFVLLLTLVFQNEINSLFEEADHLQEGVGIQPSEGTEARSLKLPIPANEKPPLKTVPQIAATNQAVMDEPKSSDQSFDLPAISKPEPMLNLNDAEDDQAEGQPVTDTSVVDDAAQPMALAEVITPPPGESSAQKQAEVRLEAQTVVGQKPLEQENSEPAPEPIRSEPPAPSERTFVAAKPVVVKEPVASAASPRRESWLLAQAPEAYTLQLIGLKDEVAAKRFIEQYRLTGEAAYFKSIRSGVAWYSVLYGHYPDRAAAIKARSTLPAALRKRDVWPRSFASVQATIKN
ncbi:MAG: AAA family ATPase [Sedimenticola sp.]|nr:AAA family ATPase [Sedimenticola sp.]